VKLVVWAGWWWCIEMLFSGACWSRNLQDGWLCRIDPLFLLKPVSTLQCVYIRMYRIMWDPFLPTISNENVSCLSLLAVAWLIWIWNSPMHAGTAKNQANLLRIVILWKMRPRFGCPIQDMCLINPIFPNHSIDARTWEDGYSIRWNLMFIHLKSLVEGQNDNCYCDKYASAGSPLNSYMYAKRCAWPLHGNYTWTSVPTWLKCNSRKGGRAGCWVLSLVLSWKRSSGVAGQSNHFGAVCNQCQCNGVHL